jgi:hypothetical protein
VLDHLLDEDAFDGLVAGAYVANAESMKGQDRDDENNRSDRGGGFQSHNS